MKFDCGFLKQWKTSLIYITTINVLFNTVYRLLTWSIYFFFFNRLSNDACDIINKIKKTSVLHSCVLTAVDIKLISPVSLGSVGD